MWEASFSPAPQESVAQWVRGRGIVMYESFEEGLKCVKNGLELTPWVWHGGPWSRVSCTHVAPSSWSTHGKSDPISTSIEIVARWEGWMDHPAPKFTTPPSKVEGWSEGIWLPSVPVQQLPTEDWSTRLPLKTGLQCNWVVLAALPQTMEIKLMKNKYHFLKKKKKVRWAKTIRWGDKQINRFGEIRKESKETKIAVT